jgi:hypothetical protein
MAQGSSLEDVLKWYMQRSCGVNARGAELKSAANTLENQMKINFKASDGWLWRFCKRHAIMKKVNFWRSFECPDGRNRTI